MLPLASHADPDIGIDDVRFLRRHIGIVPDLDDRSRFFSFDPGPIDDMLLRLIPRRTPEGDDHPHLRGRLDQRIRHIVAVADIRDLDSLQPTLLLANSQEV